MSKGIQGIFKTFFILQSNANKSLGKQAKAHEINLKFKQQYEIENNVLNRVDSNSLQKIVYILNQMLKQKVYSDGISKAFYSAITQLSSGDVSETDSFNTLGASNKSVSELTLWLETLLKSDDNEALKFLAKLISGSFSDSDTDLINKFSTRDKDDLNKISEWFAVEDTDGNLHSFSKIMLGLHNHFGNFKP